MAGDIVCNTGSGHWHARHTIEYLLTTWMEEPAGGLLCLPLELPFVPDGGSTVTLRLIFFLAPGFGVACVQQFQVRRCCLDSHGA